jgi:hypothetical protein
LAEQSLHICGMDGRKVPIGEYFYAPKLPSTAFEVPVAFDRGEAIVGAMVTHLR